MIVLCGKLLALRAFPEIISFAIEMMLGDLFRKKGWISESLSSARSYVPLYDDAWYDVGSVLIMETPSEHLASSAFHY